MRFKILAMTVVILGMAMATAVAADVTGKWTSEREGRGGETMTTNWTFKAEGTTLTGTMGGPMGENAIEEGKIDGDNISFVIKMDFGGNAMTMKFNGTVAGDEINMTMEMEGGMGGKPGGKPFEMTLKRAE